MKGMHLIYIVLPFLVLVTWQQVRAASVRDQLVQVRNELASKRKSLKHVRQQEKATLKKVKASEDGMRQQRQRLQATEKQIQKYQKDIIQKQKQVAETSHAKSQREGLKTDRVVEVFKQSVTADVLTNFSMPTVGASIIIPYLALAIEDDNKIIAGHAGKIESLVHQKASIQADKKQQETLKAAAQREYGRYGKERDQQWVVLTSVQKDQKRIAAEIRDYEAQQERLKALLARLSTAHKNQVKRPTAVVRNSEPIQPSRSSASMPADFKKFRLPVAGGKIVRGYGLYRHPDWGTSTFSNGLTISAEAGAPVRSIAGGTVAYAGNLKGYGNIIIIDHGQQVFSVYSQCGTVLKSVGTQIIKGENIATAGQAHGEKPSLYFELRSRGKAVNPTRWIVG